MMSDWPKISIVTPSFNQGRYLESTMRSVLDQGYPNFEYVVIDGGSSDTSVEIIRKYAPRLSSWVSESDYGQYDAINKGFAKTSGDIMAWLNSDDMYQPWTLSVVGEIFRSFPQVEWLTTLFPLTIDPTDRVVACAYVGGYARKGFFKGENVVEEGRYHASFIQQESTFWRRSLWQRVGGKLDTNYFLAADFDLWAKFFATAELYSVGTPLAGFREHDEQKTAQQLTAYRTEAKDVLRQAGGCLHNRWSSMLRQIGERLPYSTGVKLGVRHRRLHILYDTGAGKWRIVD